MPNGEGIEIENDEDKASHFFSIERLQAVDAALYLTKDGYYSKMDFENKVFKLKTEFIKMIRGADAYPGYHYKEGWSMKQYFLDRHNKERETAGQDHVTDLDDKEILEIYCNGASEQHNLKNKYKESFSTDGYEVPWYGRDRTKGQPNYLKMQIWMLFATHCKTRLADWPKWPVIYLPIIDPPFKGASSYHGKDFAERRFNIIRRAKFPLDDYRSHCVLFRELVNLLPSMRCLNSKGFAINLHSEVVAGNASEEAQCKTMDLLRSGDEFYYAGRNVAINFIPSSQGGGFVHQSCKTIIWQIGLFPYSAYFIAYFNQIWSDKKHIREALSIFRSWTKGERLFTALSKEAADDLVRAVLSFAGLHNPTDSQIQTTKRLNGVIQKHINQFDGSQAEKQSEQSNSPLLSEIINMGTLTLLQEKVRINELQNDNLKFAGEKERLVLFCALLFLSEVLAAKTFEVDSQYEPCIQLGVVQQHKHYVQPSADNNWVTEMWTDQKNEYHHCLRITGWHLYQLYKHAHEHQALMEEILIDVMGPFHHLIVHYEDVFSQPEHVHDEFEPVDLYVLRILLGSIWMGLSFGLRYVLGWFMYGVNQLCGKICRNSKHPRRSYYIFWKKIASSWSLHQNSEEVAHDRLSRREIIPNLRELDQAGFLIMPIRRETLTKKSRHTSDAPTTHSPSTALSHPHMRKVQRSEKPHDLEQGCFSGIAQGRAKDANARGSSKQRPPQKGSTHSNSNEHRPDWLNDLADPIDVTPNKVELMALQYDQYKFALKHAGSNWYFIKIMKMYFQLIPDRQSFKVAQTEGILSPGFTWENWREDMLLDLWYGPFNQKPGVPDFLAAEYRRLNSAFYNYLSRDFKKKLASDPVNLSLQFLGVVLAASSIIQILQGFQVFNHT